ncbi:secondary thiamine-phosphate synthase enzyme YjbQ [Teichococcus vastitatis]|uniref:Secondary thiamine-phosphate synthase enzyme YjbQ n=1 Tax=Teichococcus vastitatis TaxID=2307076 RepID=A0ABS9W415_9PROT|nr:secondary thiamine-phosphate synthase enzyme YjbQ [Pseudoroseomonas vastitatis]MCI0754019.1 secondary thiamine-phosphate synthase enzyme YjbQ [Pseudoroseomonas vastitatis]
MRQAMHRFQVTTPGRGLTEVTDALRRWLAEQSTEDGLLTVWCRHTSASLIVGENASPEVLLDLEDFLARLAPDGHRHRYRHDAEGPDDIPAHLRAAVTLTQLSIPVQAGSMLLGTWQGVFLWEHRHAPHRRELVLYLLGT